MPFFSKMMDLATGGSESPVRRLLVYYVFIVAITIGLLYLFPAANLLFSGERLSDAAGPQVLTDGLHRGAASIGIVDASSLPPRLYMVLTTFAVMIGTLVLMLPVSWVYMATRRSTGYVQSIVHTMLILPIVVAGIVLIVRNSLALAFSLAGIVAGVRFRANLKDNRDTVFIFLAIGVGLAAGVQALTVAAILSVVFNFTILMVWRTDFGRSPLDLAQKVEWSAPLSALVDNKDGTPPVPDRDLLLTLTPEKADALADRFNRVRNMLAGDRGKKGKPRYNAVLSVSATKVPEARRAVETVLGQTTKRFRLDEVVESEGKPSTLYYLVRLRKEPAQDDVLHAIMENSKECVLGAEFEASKDLEKEKSAV
jgi:hypothetical protein